MADTPNLKQLAALAKACRKSGIKSFSGFGMTFTLEDEAPKSAYKLTKAKKESAQELTDADEKFESDSLTEEQLLNWSSNLANDINSGNNT